MRNRFWPGVLLLTIGWTLPTRAASVSATSEVVTVEVRTARPAPAFSLVTVEGEKFSSATLTGKAAVVTFWASQDKPSVRQLTELVALQTQFGAERLAVVGIAVDTNELRSVIAARQVNFPVLLVDLPVIQGFGGLQAIPTTYVIDKNYNIIQQYTGFAEKGAIEKDIEAIQRQ